MASPLILAQEIFSELLKSTPQSNSTHFSSSVPSAARIPQELVDFLFSPSALIEWFKIFFFGSLLVALRKSLLHMYTLVYNSFFIVATFEDGDLSYTWLSLWLSHQPAWRNAKEVEVSTESLLRNWKDKRQEEMNLDRGDIVQGGQQLNYVPSDDTVHTMWYKSHWMRVSRRSANGSMYRRDRKYLQLCILARSRNVLDDILIEAKRAYLEAKRNRVTIYIRNRQYSPVWRVLASRCKRPLSSIILDPGIKDLLIEDVKDFLDSKDWYAARGIPFRRGYLLYGAPGSGKTSLIHSIAGELGLDVYIVSLSKSTMDDAELNDLISQLPEKCIALMEDIDAAFTSTLNRNLNEPDDDDDDDDDDDNDDVAKKALIAMASLRVGYAPITSRITLSGLLNALDGVGAQEGRILFATTNKYGSLDPALCRPGRMDIHLEFMLASRYQARELFKCFYMSEEDKEEGGGDLGYSCDISLAEKHGGRHPMASLSLNEVERLAEEFADAIPEREFSMAGLQGYLMAYKVSPLDAVKGAAAWVLKQREKGRRRDGVPKQASGNKI